MDVHEPGSRACLGLRFQTSPTGSDGPVAATLGRWGLRQTLSVPLGSAVSELARERAKLPTCSGGLGIRVAQMGYGAQATYWSAVDLHKAVMSNICDALRRPLREPHPEEATALAAKADLLATGGRC